MAAARMFDRASLFWPLQLGGWLAFAVAMALSRLGRLPFDYMVVSKGVLAVLGLSVTLALRPLYRRITGAETGVPWRALAVSVAASYLAALVWTAAFNVFSAAHWTVYYGQPARIEGIGRLIDGAVYHAFVLLTWSVLYFGVKSYDALQQERERTLRAEAQAHEARLRALRYQLNPHFLFNTLNAISTLVIEERAREAAAMIARLSDFLRLTLDHSGGAEIPLAEEIDFVRHYLAIEQVRFGERLRTELTVADDALSVPVPALILQPLVENAIKHAVAQREEGGAVGVDARRLDGRLVLRVSDDGPRFVSSNLPNVEPGHGIGLANIRERLAQSYGSAAGLALRNRVGGGLEVRIELPVGSAAP